MIIDAITVVSDSVTAHHYILRCYWISSYVYRDRMKSINEQLNRQTWNPTGSIDVCSVELIIDAITSLWEVIA